MKPELEAALKLAEEHYSYWRLQPRVATNALRILAAEVRRLQAENETLSRNQTKSQ